MSKKPNKTKTEYLRHLAEKANVLVDCVKNIVFNFKFFCFGQFGGQSFEEWEQERILSDLNNKLKNFSSKKFEELREDGTLEIYSTYPKGSRFTCPPILAGTEILWGRLRLTGRRRLIGFFSNSTEQPKKTFYVVFLDKHHEFAPSTERK